MSRFKRVILEFNGKQYTVVPEKVLGLIDVIEDHITLAEIHQDGMVRKTMRFGKLAAAYAAALNYAGADVSAEDVYFAMFNVDDQMETKSLNMIIALLTIMTPPGTVDAKLKENGHFPQSAGVERKEVTAEIAKDIGS